MAAADLTLERLRASFDYDPMTGLFTRIACADRSHIGDVIRGRTNAWGYTIFRALGKKYMAHRLAWFYVFGEWPIGQIDHIDHDKLNNSISNLRDVPQEMNQQNRKAARSDSKSGVVGVHISGDGRYLANLTIKTKKFYLGTYDTIAEASAAYRAGKRLLHAGHIDHLFT